MNKYKATSHTTYNIGYHIAFSYIKKQKSAPSHLPAKAKRIPGRIS